MTSSQSEPRFESTDQERRSIFVGRVQEQRQFQVALQGLLAHHRRWCELADEIGLDFDPEVAPGDDSYARVFLLYGIGGIGKTWLTRRFLELAAEWAADPSILVLYDDLSLGVPVLEPTCLMDRIYNLLTEEGYEEELAAYRQAQADAPRVAERVARYQAENRERWDALVQTASALIARGSQAMGKAYGVPVGETTAAFIHTATAEAAHEGAAALAKAHDLLLERMQREEELTTDEVLLFRDPLAANAAKLVQGMKQVAQQRPMVIALDTVEVVVLMEPFLRDHLVLPTVGAPILWVISGRYNLADERVVEVTGQRCVHKGYRDLLGRNPPVVWDMAVFSDADVREYLEAQIHRRCTSLEIDDELVTVVKGTSGGVPLAVEMATDALCALDRSAFLRNFALRDETLLPGDRLAQVTARFLRYCLVQGGEDLERVRGMAILCKGADERALRAVWNLSPEQKVRDVLARMRSRYAFVQTEGLHDAVYDFIRRELRTSPTLGESRAVLGSRAAAHYRTRWEREHDVSGDPALRVRDPRWQQATHHRLNALLWADPDEAVCFLLPRFVEALGFDLILAVRMLEQAEEFLAENTLPLRQADALLLRRLREWSREPDPRLFFVRLGWLAKPRETLGQMVEALLKAPGLEPLHLTVLHLWRGRWLAAQECYNEALGAYLEAERHLPTDAADLRDQLGEAFEGVGSDCAWRRKDARIIDALPSPEAELALSKALFLGCDSADVYWTLGCVQFKLDKCEESLQSFSEAIRLDPKHGAAWNVLGLVHRELGQYKEALAAFRKAAEFGPPFYSSTYLGSVYSNLGLVYCDLHQPEDAIPIFFKAIAFAPKLALPWNNLGFAYHTLGRHEKAAEALQKAIKLDPELVQSWGNLGFVYCELGRYEEAAKAFQKTVELDPKLGLTCLGALYADLGRYEEAIEVFLRAVEFDPQHAISWYILGYVHQKMGKHEKAVEAYHKAIEFDPAYAWPYNNLGIVYEREGDYDRAADLYRQAVERHRSDKDRAVSWKNLGDLYRHLGWYEEAIEAYRQTVKLDPNGAWSWNNLGDIYYALGRCEEAIEAYHRAISLNSQLAWPCNSLGHVYCHLGRYEEAIAAYQEAIGRDALWAYPYNNLGHIYRALGQCEKAIEAYQKAMELDSKFAWPCNSLGHIYRALGRYEEAIAAYRKAIERDPQLAYPYSSLGYVYRALGRYEEAIAACRKAVDVYRKASVQDPEDAYLHTMLGYLYELEGRLEEALQERQRAAELQPDDAMAHSSLASVLRKLGREQEAAEHLACARELMAKEVEYNKACIEAIAGNTDAALDHLKKALEQAPGNRLWARCDPDLVSLHENPHFWELVGQPAE